MNSSVFITLTTKTIDTIISETISVKEYYILGYDTVEIQLMFRRNISPPGLWLKNKPSKMPV
jgi:hypothetical protein